MALARPVNSVGGDGALRAGEPRHEPRCDRLAHTLPPAGRGDRRRGQPLHRAQRRAGAAQAGEERIPLQIPRAGIGGRRRRAQHGCGPGRVAGGQQRRVCVARRRICSVRGSAGPSPRCARRQGSGGGRRAAVSMPAIRAGHYTAFVGRAEQRRRRGAWPIAPRRTRRTRRPARDRRTRPGDMRPQQRPPAADACQPAGRPRHRAAGRAAARRSRARPPAIATASHGIPRPRSAP